MLLVIDVFFRRIPFEVTNFVILTSSHELDTSDLDNPAGLRFIKLLGKQRWRDIIQRRMRSKMIIVLSPGFDLFLGVLKRHKPVGV